MENAKKFSFNSDYRPSSDILKPEICVYGIMGWAELNWLHVLIMEYMYQEVL